MALFIFEANGKPEPQGSAKAFKRGDKIVVTSDNPHVKSWRSVVADAAKAAMEAEGVALLDRPAEVMVGAMFSLDRPASLTAKKRPYPVTLPDLDKLIRGLGDALTGIVWRDDSQVCRWVATKRYCREGERPGVVVSISRMDAE